MKISLRWIFDHIKGELADINVSQLVDTFIKTTAEIEGWREVSTNTDLLTLANVITIDSTAITVYSPEKDEHYLLPKRADGAIDQWFLVTIDKNTPSWATSIMVGGTKDMILPAVYCRENMRNGDWKTAIESKDYIVEVDNKSINSRPDLWGHRGLAREIAALLNLPLRPLQEFIIEKESIEHSSFIAIKAADACSRFATLSLPSIQAQPSHLDMIIRLSRLDARAINFLVDATNYVMLDLGQPMHAFDADTISAEHICVEYAGDKEKLPLLDGEVAELSSQDLIISDNGKPISLAGIMGGSATAIKATTQSVLLEAAHFDPVIIRRTSARHKKRTESSMRFEKNLDPMNNMNAIKRYLFLLEVAQIPYDAQDVIFSWGKCPEQKSLMIRHSFIEARLGVLIKPERIVAILDKLEFGIEQSVEDDSIIYMIRIPSFRATKDIKIVEDIVEEVGRYIGYDTLPRVMPALQLRSHDLHATNATRAIKQFLSYGLQMRELYGYSFFDESVLKELAWQPIHSIEIKNPISENYTRMVTTLQPHMLKAIAENSITHSRLRFYEWARVWHMRDEEIVEQKSLSGVFYDAVQTFGFYDGKALLSRLFDQWGMNITWKSIQDNDYSWLSLHERAGLFHEDVRIGTAGMVDHATVKKLSSADAAIFIFELDADYLIKYKKHAIRFEPLSKYPLIRRDVSIMILVSAQADTLVGVIKSVDKRIVNVQLVDFFSRPEWKDQKAMTFHVEIEDKEKTMTSEEVEVIWNRVITQLQQQGATIR